MLGRVKLSPLIRLLPAAALATGLVCALEAFSGAAGADGGAGEPATGSPDAAATAPAGAPDGGASRADRHKLRRFRKAGPGGAPDGGVPVDAARLPVRDGGILQMAF